MSILLFGIFSDDLQMRYDYLKDDRVYIDKVIFQELVFFPQISFK